MSAIETFSFDGYTLRPARTSRDLALATRWTEADRDHREVDPAFWVEQKLGQDSYLLTGQGGPIFFFKVAALNSSAVELHIQFPPMPEAAEARREQTMLLRDALSRGFAWLERVLIQSHVREVYFDSTSTSLIAFCVHHLEFQHDNGKLRKLLLSPLERSAEDHVRCY